MENWSGRRPDLCHFLNKIQKKIDFFKKLFASDHCASMLLLQAKLSDLKNHRLGKSLVRRPDELFKLFKL